MGKNILVLGAGQSTTYLIRRLLERAAKHDWTVTVGDWDAGVAAERTAGFSRGTRQIAKLGLAA